MWVHIWHTRPYMSLTFLLMAVIVSSCPIASANAIWCSASLHVSDFAHEAHLLMILVLHSVQIVVNLCQTDFLSYKTTLTPFGCPRSFGSTWLSGHDICCIWPCVSSLPGAGSGLLNGMIVLCSFLCFLPGLIFMLFILRTSSAKPSCAEERSNVKTPMQLRCVNSKTLIVILIWSINCTRSHQASKPFSGYVIFRVSNAGRRCSTDHLSWLAICSSEGLIWPIVSEMKSETWITCPFPFFPDELCKPHMPMILI